MKRRTFIETSVGAALFAAGSSWAAAEEHKISRVGLQLYTVRGEMKNDFEGTIAKVAATGYKEVEFAGYYNHSPKDVRALLDKDGLTAPSTHIAYPILENKLPETIDAAHVIGHKFIVCPWIDEKQRNADGWKRAAELFNKTGEATKKAGVQFAYHNHSFEFAPAEGLDGKLAYDYLLGATDPKLVKMEMDLCWISVAGKDPLDYFNKYPGRFPMVHVKDYVNDPNSTSSYAGATGSVSFKGRLEDVGKGSIDFKRIFADSAKGGIQHYFVENDDAKQPFEDIKISYDYLEALRF
ncbi:MAG TPA: sugar phosphate isomerase/epimerase [Candidatus Methylomirabilis sp.]|nr:sugar phosphate isomerase/epimerase [Candidatus Methylomirabilis sp.]